MANAAQSPPGRPLRRQRSGDDRHPRQLLSGDGVAERLALHSASRRPAGFLHLLDDTTLAMADFGGNRQYITTGNLRGSDRACLFLMDYPRRARLKIYATVEVLAAEDHPQLLAQVAPANYRARIERLFLFHLQAFDWNCPQHITPRYSAQQVAEY
ncbi:pyridoxamine 5'-phosphate oxidase family protein, partial [Pseudomonas aeruginosa]|nr:pyridoxamine 5'-phosphate oxidase family protein [Pseudomonas aeruginosa]